MVYLEKQDNLDENIKSLIIPPIIQFLNSTNVEVLLFFIKIKELAGKQLGLVAAKLNEKDRGEFVLKHVLLMAHDDADEINRITAVRLLTDMSSCLGLQLC
jgi:serine/threonine-protein phosphatase 4 regulatory subunit 1